VKSIFGGNYSLSLCMYVWIYVDFSFKCIILCYIFFKFASNLINWWVNMSYVGLSFCYK
jgi:hypothetical protein